MTAGLPCFAHAPTAPRQLHRLVGQPRLQTTRSAIRHWPPAHSHRAGARDHVSTNLRICCVPRRPCLRHLAGAVQSRRRREAPARTPVLQQVANTEPGIPYASYPTPRVCPTPAISCEAVAPVPSLRGHAAAPCRIRPGAAASLVSFIALFCGARTPPRTLLPCPRPD